MSHIKNQIPERRNMIMNNGRRIGLIMIITGATLWGLSGPMIQWLFQHTNVSSIYFLKIRFFI
jgi:drug/metabolite transporter (DMT)-like permease